MTRISQIRIDKREDYFVSHCIDHNSVNVKFKFLAKFLYYVMNGVFILNFALYAV